MHVVFILSLILPQMMYAQVCDTDPNAVLASMFYSLGNDCETYLPLFASDAQFYHQINGYKNKSELSAVCTGYGGFCPTDECFFQQNGALFAVENGDRCEVLAPFLWSQIPANNKVPNNREPHSGFIHNTLIPDSSAEFGYTIEVFREIEDSYTVPFNWGASDDSSVQSWTIELLNQAASSGECDAPLQPLLTTYFGDKSAAATDDLYRQQGNAVVIAAGGVCHVLIPYSAVVSNEIVSGRVSIVLTPVNNESYTLASEVWFPSDSVVVQQEIECESAAASTISSWSHVFIVAIVAVVVCIGIF